MNTLLDMITQDPSEMPSQHVLRGVSKQRKPMAVMMQTIRAQDGTASGLSCCLMPADYSLHQRYFANQHQAAIDFAGVQVENTEAAMRRSGPREVKCSM
mmetsp:Transcript_26170/g.61368  ORF Transcript_26170/g.61368 Transcript_26170/m.61368 type:complete len:99 (+) Transcript_26170:1-297(+)